MGAEDLILMVQQALMPICIFLGLLSGVLFHARCVSAEPAASVKEFFSGNASDLFRCAWLGALAFIFQYAIGNTDFPLLLAALNVFSLLITMSLSFSVGIVATSFAKALAAMEQRSLKR